MAVLKYFGEYLDVQNINHRFEILQLDEFGQNLITNGNFGAGGANWVFNAGFWSFNNNGAHYVGNFPASNAQFFDYLAGRTYEVKLTVYQLINEPISLTVNLGGLLGTITDAGEFTFQTTLINDADQVSFTGVDGDFSITNIIVREQTLGPTEIRGKVTLDYSTTQNPLEAIRGQGLSLELEASTDLTFVDLFSNFQRVFEVKYFRDALLLFDGWLDNEGIFQDYVNDRWIITLNALDGLGFLEDLSYVDSDGTPYIQKQSDFEVIQRALLRTGLELNINTNIDIYYTGLADTVDVLKNVFVNGGRFVKEDEQTIMSCEQVLRDTLDRYAAVITSFNGEWFIYKPNQLYLNSTATFYRYDFLGNPLAPTTVTIDLSQLLGSQINGFFPHHAEQNQIIELKNSIGAYRINYKYGFDQTLFNNPFLETLDGVTIDFWTINSNSNMFLPQPSGFGVTFLVPNEVSQVLNLTSEQVSVNEGFVGTVTIRLTSFFPPFTGGRFDFQIKLTATQAPNTVYFLNDAGGWDENFTDHLFINISGQGIPIINTTELPPAVEAGNIEVLIHTPFTSLSAGGQVQLQEVNLAPLSGANTGQNLVGQIYTFQRNNRPVSKIQDIKEVFNADSPLDIYEGTIYQNDEETPTETWFRKGFTEEREIIEIMGMETMRINQDTAKVFSGSIFGFMPYLSVVTIDGINGVFMFVEYSYNTKANVTNIKLREIFGFEIGDLDIQKQPDYGTTVKPTITG